MEEFLAPPIAEALALEKGGNTCSECNVTAIKGCNIYVGTVIDYIFSCPSE